ncbi:chromate transporter [Aquabacterium sp. OR-4]|uniref:chromate transporter n=1 Tax=Aquabacterium sp. OR-4 TaxID=2978127 RepID=UPI0021B2BB9F|nr:chromate transporter [Aquabacterium sp. OR-4]MDT7834911.1 chromate transporter [Aquabacterium sp. OR-4]
MSSGPVVAAQASTAWFDLAALLGGGRLGAADLLALWGHFMLLSLLSVGGAMAAAPDMQRWLVAERGWLSDGQFTDAVAIAQAAPGPNLLFVALVGWSTAGAAGMLAAMSGLLLPSSLLALAAGRYGRRNAQSLAVRAFTAGLAPLTVGLLLSTGAVLAAPLWPRPGALALVAASALIAWRTRIGPLWLIGGGALAGLAGWA